MHPFPVRNRITPDTRSFHLSVRILVSITEPFSFEIIEIEINPLRLIIFPQRIESNSIKISLFLMLVKILPFLMEFYNIYIYIRFTLEHNSKLSILRLLHHFPSLIRALPLSPLISLSLSLSDLAFLSHPMGVGERHGVAKLRWRITSCSSFVPQVSFNNGAGQIV